MDAINSVAIESIVIIAQYNQNSIKLSKSICNQNLLLLLQSLIASDFDWNNILLLVCTNCVEHYWFLLQLSINCNCYLMHLILNAVNFNKKIVTDCNRFICTIGFIATDFKASKRHFLLTHICFVYDINAKKIY